MTRWDDIQAEQKAQRVAVAYVGTGRVGVAAQAITDGAGMEALDGVLDVVARSDPPASLGAAIRAAFGRPRYYPPGSDVPTWKALGTRWKQLIRRFGATSNRQLSRDFVRVVVICRPDAALAVTATRGDGRGSFLEEDAGPLIELPSSTSDTELGEALLRAADSAPPRPNA